ncbi:MAG: alpha/beta fold hydrolase [Longimicrobiales bacterium]
MGSENGWKRWMAPALLSGLVTAGCVTSSGAQAGRPAPTTPASDEAVELAVPGATLYGTLRVPAGSGRHAVALIIAGSGPTDRNGNSAMLPGPNNSLKMLAEGLSANGIASVRYDKRGIGASAASLKSQSEADLRFTMYSDDAAAWIARLRADSRFSKIIVIGHSEGALLGTIAARIANADGLILVAGAGRPIGEVLREQLKNSAPALAEKAEPMLRELESGRMVKDVPADMQFLFRPSIQPYMISWLPLDPRAELARLDAPRLVIQGTTDVQASPRDAERLASADASVRLEMVNGMNHILKIASGTAQEQMPSYSDPALPLAPRLLDVIVPFIQAIH